MLTCASCQCIYIITNICSLFIVCFDPLRNCNLAVYYEFTTSNIKLFWETKAFALKAEYDLDYGSKNDYVPADTGDGGQGQFGAVSPSNWRVPGTSPVGENSYAGAADGGEEPWFAEAVSTVSLDLEKADEAYTAFTITALDFKVEAFGKTSPFEWPGVDAGKDELLAAIGYEALLATTPNTIKKAWAKIHPEPEKEKPKKKE